MVIILGLGFTGRRLARRLLQRGEKVFSAARNIERFRDLAETGLTLAELKLDGSFATLLPRHAIVVNLIPPLPEPENTALREVIHGLEPARVVYISSTGVYGAQVDVDSHTAANPNDERGRRRLHEELWVESGPWTSLILRAAAIYGPGRGVHVALREGKVPRGAGSGVVSRIHVEDLAAIIEKGIYSDLQGAWPVADEGPCSSAELAQWCAELLKLTGLQTESTAPEIAGRRVDGTGIRELLGIELKYSSWRTGIPASLEEEEKEN